MKARSVTRASAPGAGGGGAAVAPARRPYASPLREKQAEATREAILQALTEQLAEEGLADFAIPQVARRAGVTTRTVYRHFPSRDALLDALDEWVDERMGDMGRPRTATEMVEQVPALFAAFEAQADLCRALLARGPGAIVRQHGRRRRTRRFVAALRAELPHLPEDALREAGAALHVLCGLSAWQAMREVWGLEPEQAARAALGAARCLLDDLHRREERA